MESENNMIRKQLCKWFDDDKKGYITIEDTAPIIQSLIVIGLYIYGMYIFLFTNFPDSTPTINTWNLLKGIIMILSVSLSALIIIIGSIFITITTWEKTKDLKIISCKKDLENND